MHLLPTVGFLLLAALANTTPAAGIRAKRAERVAARLDSDNTEGVGHALADIEELERAAEMPDLTRPILTHSTTVELNDEAVTDIISEAISTVNARSSAPFRDVVVEKKAAQKDGDVYEIAFTIAQTTCPKRVTPAQELAGLSITGACERDFSALDIRDVTVRARLRQHDDPPTEGAGGKWTLAFLGTGPPVIRAPPVSGWV